MRRAVLIALLALPWAAESASALPRGGFDYVQFPIHGRRTDTVSYDFDGDGKPDLLNVSIDFDVEPRVRWFALHPMRAGGLTTKPERVWAVDRRAAALVFGDFLPGGGVEIGFLAEDGVYAYPPAEGGPDGKPLKLLHLRTWFDRASDEALPVWQYALDLSADGRHDLIVPVPDGYKVYFQTAPAAFGSVSDLEARLKRNRALAASRRAKTSDVVASFFSVDDSLPRVVPVDVDGDGRLDLVSIDGNTLTVFFQRQPRAFSSAMNWRYRFIVKALEEEVRKDVINFSVVAFADINADRNADLVVTQIYGEVGLFDSIKTTIYIHYGNGRGNFDVSARIQIDGVTIDPVFVDMNGDGRLDCLTSRLRTDLLSQAAKGVLLGDISIDYEVFQFDPTTGGYLGSPVYQYPVRVTFDDMKDRGAGARPMMFIGADFTGDGRPDQIRYNPKSEELEFHEGKITPRGQIHFEPTPWETFKPSRTPGAVVLYDCTGDDKSDVLLLNDGFVGLLVQR